MKVSFSLSKKPETPSPFQPKKPSAPAQKPSLFNADDDDDDGDLLAPKPKTNRNNGIGTQTLSAETSKAQKKRELAEMAVDSTVYQYDEVWEKLQVAKQKVKEAKLAESKEHKPKYIGGLLASAETRKLDRLRAEEKMIQRERDMEGDEFKDKEAFVTQAYKDQMAELRKAEEEEKVREEAEKKKKKKGFGGGMAQFYQKLLEEEAKAHEETVALTTSPSSDPSSSKRPQGPNLTITKPPTLEPPIPGTKSDLDLAKEAAQKGVDIELNDDNQIVDKRELLSAGLNMSMANTRKLGLKSASSSSGTAAEPVNAHRAVGVAASRNAINARRAREIQTQLTEEEERLRSERERREREARERVVAKRNNEEDVQSAKERYLARKRRKLEEQAALDQQQLDGVQQSN